MMNGKSKIEFISVLVPFKCVDFMLVMTLEMEAFCFAFVSYSNKIHVTCT